MNIWTTISSKTFFQSLLDLLRTKDIPEVQMKLLGLIQKWGLNFEDRKNSLPNFFGVYNKLKNNSVQFPNNYESNYQIYVSNNRSSNNYQNNYNNKNDEFEFENENGSNDKEEGETFCYMDSLKNILKVPNFQHKYRRLVNFLVKMQENIQLANLIMNSGGRSGLKDIINTLREGNNTLIDTINGGRLKDEKLMELTLGTTEDINQTLNRDDDLKNGYKPKKFTSYFVLNNTIPIKGSNNYRSRAKSTKSKKSIQKRDHKYKNYDTDLNTYDMNKYKEKMGKAKNNDDIFDLFSTSNPLKESGFNNNQPINDFFSSQAQITGNNNDNQYQLRNDPINNIFNINNNNNNRSTIMMGNNNNNTNFFNSSNNNNNFNGNNNMNNNYNFGRQFNQNNNQSRPVMANYNNNVEQSNNFNSQSMQFNQGVFNNNNNNNNNDNNLMSMLDSLGPAPPGNSSQLVPYIGNFNQNNNNQNNFMNNNNQFNNFNNNSNNNFNNNNNNSNQFNNFNNFNQMNNNNTFDNNRGNTFMSQNMNSNNNNNNQMNFNTNMSINMNNNNFGMDQNNNQQMTMEEMEKQRKLKELDDLF